MSVTYDTAYLKEKDWNQTFDQHLASYEAVFGMRRIDVIVKDFSSNIKMYTPVYAVGKGTGQHAKFRNSIPDMYASYFSTYKVKNPMGRKWK
jgi:hypothetical protein